MVVLAIQWFRFNKRIVLPYVTFQFTSIFGFKHVHYYIIYFTNVKYAIY